MTRLIGPDLTPDLLQRFSPNALHKHAHNVVLIMSVGEDNYPHPAMLSHFEIVARDSHNLRITTYSDSRTTSNMRRTGQLTMAIVDEGVAYYLKGSIEEVRPRMTTAPHNALFNFQIESVSADHADVEREGATSITCGISYDDPNMTAKIANAGETFNEMLS